MDQILSFSRQNAEPNATVKVNNEDVAVNKCVLALSSSYFERYFFYDCYARPENIELPESTTVEDFKRMIATLPPENRELDDECFEAVIILADRFFMDNVLSLCRNFLMCSDKPKLFKFRIAHKYGWTELEKQIVRSIHMCDNFVENAEEYGMMDDDTRAAFTARHAEIVASRNRGERQGGGGWGGRGGWNWNEN